MDERDYEQAFQLILKAGNAKSAAIMAVEAAREGDYEKADSLLADCDREMHEAHDLQFEMIQKEAAGDHVELNIILVHAQDHLTMALMARDNAQEFIRLYQMLDELKKDRL